MCKEISFENLIKIAYKEITENTAFDGIGRVCDCGNEYLVIAGDPNEVYYTTRALLVNKSDGKIIWYTYLYELEHPVEIIGDVQFDSEYCYKKKA